MFSFVFVKRKLKDKIVFAADEVISTDESSHLDAEQKAQIKELFSQGVKHKMKTQNKLVRQLSTGMI